MSTSSDFNQIADKVLNDYELKETVTVVSSAKRHAIQLSDIQGISNQYNNSNTFKSKELITKPVNSIALFCNEYIPDHFSTAIDYFKYTMTVNGRAYEISPINSKKGGKKIIRTSTGVNIDYVEYISEPITSAFLTIELTSPNINETPYVSNIKILTGGVIDNV